MNKTIYFFILLLISISFSCKRESNYSDQNSKINLSKIADSNRQKEVVEVKEFDFNKVEIGDKIQGVVISILDGDTYDLLLEDYKTIRVRMEGIDAPEGGMPYYRVAKNKLDELAKRSQVTILVTGKDQYNRLLAYTFLDDGRELSHEMVESGLAWHFKKYNSEESLASLEIYARENELGLWKDNNPWPPWEIRTLRRSGVSTKELFK